MKNGSATARDFFDYWIEHEAAATDLNSVGAKMQLARKLAETVARVHDPIMRGAVASKVSARLGVPARDFESLLARPVRERAPGSAEGRARPAPAPRHDVAMLCLLALRDAEAREFLLNESWREVLAQTPDAEMLVRILESDLRPEDAGVNQCFHGQFAPGGRGLGLVVAAAKNAAKWRGSG